MEYNQLDIYRDHREEQLAVESNKLNMEERRNNGMHVILYLLRKENVLTIWCMDERTKSAAEFVVEPSDAYEWFDHAFAHPDANLARYEQRENGEQV
jgi:hypothetical protein